MSRKSFQIGISIVAGFLVLISFMNCAPVHEAYEAGLSSSSDFSCIGPYEEAFQKTIHDLAVNSCTLCHRGAVSTAPAFAIDSHTEAFSNILQFEKFNGMASEGREIFYTQMTTPHGGCTECNQDQSLVDSYRAEWQKADNEYQACTDVLNTTD